MNYSQQYFLIPNQSQGTVEIWMMKTLKTHQMMKVTMNYNLILSINRFFKIKNQKRKDKKKLVIQAENQTKKKDVPLNDSIL